MKLIGSVASPFVRRIRLMLNNADYEFEKIDVFSEAGKRVMKQYSPTLRVPILVDGSTSLWDSMLITEYLTKKEISLENKKKLVLINELTDAGVQLFQMRKFDIDTKDQSVFSQNNLHRIGIILDLFESDTDLKWDLVGQWLFCTLDWFSFRSIYSWEENHPRLKTFIKECSTKEKAIETDPRV